MLRSLNYVAFVCYSTSYISFQMYYWNYVLLKLTALYLNFKTSNSSAPIVIEANERLLPINSILVSLHLAFGWSHWVHDPGHRTTTSVSSSSSSPASTSSAVRTLKGTSGVGVAVAGRMVCRRLVHGAHPWRPVHGRTSRGTGMVVSGGRQVTPVVLENITQNNQITQIHGYRNSRILGTLIRCTKENFLIKIHECICLKLF